MDRVCVHLYIDSEIVEISVTYNKDRGFGEYDTQDIMRAIVAGGKDQVTHLSSMCKLMTK